MNYHSRKTCAIINLPALVNNYNCIANLSPQSQTIAVIKANAYGHDSVEVAKALSQYAPAFAVAFIDEALILRDAGITQPILILEGALSQEDFSIALKQDFWLMLHNTEQVDWLKKQVQPYTGELWLKVDTGMNRLGVLPNKVDSILDELSNEQLQNLVICTHFSNAEELDNPKTLSQIKQLEQVNQRHHYKTSLANSAGIFNWPESHSDYNRLGIALYGTTSILAKDLPVELTPVMTLQSTVIGLRTLNIGESVGYGEIWQAKRPSRIATIAIGYGDGYPRSAKAGTPVFIKGQIAPIAGCVSMDMITIDVTDIGNVELGDLVELWGENLAVETVAKHMDTINYELLTRVSARVPKKYIF
jgi:alanine racemase